MPTDDARDDAGGCGGACGDTFGCEALDLWLCVCLPVVAACICINSREDIRRCFVGGGAKRLASVAGGGEGELLESAAIGLLRFICSSKDRRDTGGGGRGFILYDRLWCSV